MEQQKSLQLELVSLMLYVHGSMTRLSHSWHPVNTRKHQVAHAVSRQPVELIVVRMCCPNELKPRDGQGSVAALNIHAQHRNTSCLALKRAGVVYSKFAQDNSVLSRMLCASRMAIVSAWWRCAGRDDCTSAPFH